MKIELIDHGLNLEAYAPKRAHHNDAGADVFLQSYAKLPARASTKINLGFGLKVPDGYAAYIFPRSSLASRGIVCELPPIDSGYRGPIHAIVSNMTDSIVHLYEGERIGQLVVMPVIIATFVAPNELNDARGEGAFGSTGK